MDAIDRMFHVLVKTLRKTNPALLTSPFTVGDLHQQIIPYRHFRRELDLESNQEYEHALMSLLSGERGYLDADDRLRDAMRAELASGTAEPARLRHFTDSPVSVNQAALSQVPERPAAPGTPTTPSGVSSATPPARGPTSASCRYCGGELPVGRVLNYCPHCGQNLQVHHCPACGAELEAGWRFCVSCGKTVS